MKKKMTFAVKAFTVVAIVAGVATAGFNITETQAVASAPSGTCGLLLSRNFAGFDTYMNGSNGVGSTIAGTVNFDTNTGTAKVTVINNYGLNNAVNAEVVAVSTISPVTQVSPGVYTLTMTTSAEGQTWTQQYNMLSTNSGNTLLLKSVPTTNNNTGAWAGVCQAL